MTNYIFKIYRKHQGKREGKFFREFEKIFPVKKVTKTIRSFHFLKSTNFRLYKTVFLNVVEKFLHIVKKKCVIS